MAAALPVHGVGEGEVGVGQLGKDVVRGLGQFSGGGQQTLLTVGQGVGPAALDVVEIPAEQICERTDVPFAPDWLKAVQQTGLKEAA